MSNTHEEMALGEIPDDVIHDAAFDFIKTLGVMPTPDAIEQLAGPYALSLMIMSTRGYSPDGATWRSKGWKGLVLDILNKAGRLKYRSWRNDEFDGDSAIDILTFSGMYWRHRNQGTKWGELGEPG